MKFWVVTPSFNQLDWLKLCVASVADQASEAVQVHHHIQDACSTDGTPEWLKRYEQETAGQRSGSERKKSGYSFSYASEKDDGMYDAINKGWKRMGDDLDVISHLNCDEQYLPEALKNIATFLSCHQRADVVLADMVVVDDAGNYICHRRSLKPYAWTSLYCCGGFTATTFQRASVTKTKGIFFDTSWRNFGDKVWYNTLHNGGCRFEVYNHMVSVFTDTGDNLNWTDEGKREKRRYEEEFLHGSERSTRLVARLNGLRRALKELTLKPPAFYSIYLLSGDKRETVAITQPTGLWHKKWKI